jgi:hypothetical protein
MRLGLNPPVTSSSEYQTPWWQEAIQIGSQIWHPTQSPSVWYPEWTDPGMNGPAPPYYAPQPETNWLPIAALAGLALVLFSRRR